MNRIRIAASSATALALAALALTGCSSGGGASDEGSTVSYMTWESNATNTALDASMARFAKASGIAVERKDSPNADYAQKLASLIIAKKAPDLFWCTTAQAQNLAAEGLLHDWTDELKAGRGIHRSGFSPGSLDMWTTPDGKVAGIPTLANTYGFFYNADTFRSAGLDVPAAGWTWDQLFDDLAALKSADPATTPLVAQWPLLDSPQGVSAYSVSNGGAPFVNDFTRATKVTTDATFREGAARFRDAVAAGQMTDPDYDATNAPAAFSNGKVPLMFGGQWVQQLIAPNEPAFDWGFAPWPVGTGGSVQPIETNGVCSPATIRDPASAWKALAYMETTGFNDTMAKVPVAPIAYESGSKGYYAALKDAGDAASASVAATAEYDLGTKDKFVTQFLDQWAVKAADVVTTSWNPMIAGDTGVDDGVGATAKGVRGLISR